MKGEPIVEKLIIRDGLSYVSELKLTNVKLSEAIIMLDEYNESRGNKNMCKIWTCRIGLHNFPDLHKKTVCLECGMTVQEYRKQKRRRLITVKNIILHVKMNVRRWRTQQIQRIKEIIDRELERREETEQKSNMTM